MSSKDSDIARTTRLIRLTYYNDVLLKNGNITKREHQRMNNAILAKYQKTNYASNCSPLKSFHSQ